MCSKALGKRGHMITHVAEFPAYPTDINLEIMPLIETIAIPIGASVAAMAAH